MVTGFILNAIVFAQILNDAIGVGFAVTIVRKKINCEVDVRFAKD